MNRWAKILTFWIPFRGVRHWARKQIIRLFIFCIPLHKDWIVFYDTFSKSGNGDSIRPLAVELRKRRPDMRFFFVSNSPRDIEMADEVLVVESERYDYIMKRAKYMITPMEVPGGKRRGQIWVMTWHGNAIKSIYLHHEQTPKMYKIMEPYKRIDMWTIPSTVTRDIFAQMFNLALKVFVPTGVPRNDILCADDKTKNDVITNTRKKLGLSENDKVIFYCPTWRSGDHKMPFMIDIDYMKSTLGKEYKLLVRSHTGRHNWVDKNGNQIIIKDDSVIDVGEYPMVSDLYLIADIFISDYSSAILDFAILKKPILLFDYDYDEYMSKTGFVYDYANEIPAPILRESHDLIDAIKDIQDVLHKYSKRYNAFNKKWNEFEKGNATIQVLDLLKLK